MRSRLRVLLLTLLASVSALVPATVRAGDGRTVDWPAFLARQDLTWSRLPASWEEGAFLGNGTVGAMVYASEDGRSLDWQLGRTDVVDHRDHPEPLIASPRLPIGRLRLEFGQPARGAARLSLWNAELGAELALASASARVRSFVHATEPVIVIDASSTSPGTPPRVWFEPDLAINERLLVRKVPLTEDDLNPAPFVTTLDGVQVSVQRRRSGGEYVVAWMVVPRAEGITVYCSIADSYPGQEARPAAAAAVGLAARQGIDRLAESHRAWWHTYYPASFVSLPDARLESFYWIQMYKLASAMRADSLVLDNQGPWYRRTPWPAAWWNLNVQLSYWPAYASNRLALGESLVRFVDTRREVLRANVPDALRADSMAIGRASGPDGRSPVDLRASWTPASGAYELSNLVWVMHNVWLQWRHTMDERLLSEVLFPVLSGSVRYLQHRLEPGADGRLHLPEAISPEYPRTAPDTNYDLSLLRWGCTTLIDLDTRLAATDPSAARCRDTLARLVDYPVDANGFMIGRDVPFAESHRHFSHLLMVYPLRLVTGETAEQRDLVERSLRHWIGFEGALQGYSFVGASAISSLLGKGEDAARHLQALIERFVKPNTMYLESGPVIETPLAAAQAVHEMLLQGHGGVIRVFPAVPASWQDVAFADLRTEGAFLVTAVRKAGRTVRVRVHSVAGEPALLRLPPGDTALRPDSASRGRVQRLKAGEWRLRLARGESVEFADSRVPASVVAPVARRAEEANPFGIR